VRCKGRSEDKERKTSLMGRTKFFADALKHMVGKLPSDPVKIPTYFENRENIESCGVPGVPSLTLMIVLSISLHGSHARS